MTIMHFSLLADIVLLEIFSYLSCSDALYAFAEFHNLRFIDLLYERGAFGQICLSAELPRRQYINLLESIWRFDSVRSLVVMDSIADHIVALAPRQLFPSLNDLRLLHLRHILDGTAAFIVAHAHTLTHLTITPTVTSPYSVKAHSDLLHDVLPHLSRLTTLNMGYNTRVQVGNFVPCPK
jgi:hypothetical protein